MNIKRMVMSHVKTQGWPSAPAKVGPATCGQPRPGYKAECRTAHAYAEAVESSIHREEPFYVFIYHRPCNLHDGASKVGKLEYGE